MNLVSKVLEQYIQTKRVFRKALLPVIPVCFWRESSSPADAKSSFVTLDAR